MVARVSIPFAKGKVFIIKFSIINKYSALNIDTMLCTVGDAEAMKDVNI